MAQVKFGRKQLLNPTPSKLANSILIGTIIAGVLITWLPSASFIPATISTVMQSILGLLLAIANSIKPFFGIQTTQQEVDIQDVSEMEMPSKD